MSDEKLCEWCHAAPVYRRYPSDRHTYCSHACCAKARHFRERGSHADRFSSLVSPEPTSGCWLWIGPYSGNGYGRMRVEGKEWPAHRLSLFLATGTAPPTDLEVCHRCDNPACVNPDHLFLGTHLDNMRDAARKGLILSPRRDKPTCKRGHDRTPENTRTDKRGHRSCRVCNRLRDTTRAA